LAFHLISKQINQIFFFTSSSSQQLPLIRFTISSASLDKSPSGRNGLSQPESVLKAETGHQYFSGFIATLVGGISVFEFTTTLNGFYRSFCNDTRSWGFRKHSIDFHRAKSSIAEISIFESFLNNLSQTFCLKGHFRVSKRTLARSFQRRKRKFGLKVTRCECQVYI
jgi:hypothetical protein